MLNRIDFLKKSGAAALAGVLTAQGLQASSSFLPAAKRPIGLQLFTLFKVLDNDVAGHLKKVAAIGYQEIESAFSRKGGYYGLKPREFAALTKDLGLAWRSHHVLSTYK